MARRVVEFVTEPREDVYRALLRWIAKRTISMTWILHSQKGLSSRGLEFVKSANPELEWIQETSEWPGTSAAGYTVKMLKYRLTERLLGVLETSVDGLYAWQHPDRPEDPALYRADRVPLLATIAHESAAILMLEESEIRELQQQVVGLDVRIPEVGQLWRDMPTV